MNKLTSAENRLIKELISQETDTGSNKELNKELDVIYEKIDSLTLRKIEDLDITELRELVYDLMNDASNVQGMETEDFCLEFHNLEW